MSFIVTVILVLLIVMIIFFAILSPKRNNYNSPPTYTESFIDSSSPSSKTTINKPSATGNNFQKMPLLMEKTKEYAEMEADDVFEDNYSYEADSLMEKYEDACIEVETAFYDVFDLSKRIKLLENAISKYDKWKNFCYEKGDAVKRYFERDYSAASKHPYSPVDCDMSGDYIGEYENADFTNIEFLKSVFEYYISHPDEAKAHLHDEYVFYCGGLEEYEFLMKVQSLPKDLLNIIKKNDNIMQKDLYGMFDKRMKSHIQKVVKELSTKGKIVAVKSGNSYMLTIKK